MAKFCEIPYCLTRIFQNCLTDMVQLLYTRLPTFTENQKPLLKKLKMRSLAGDKTKRKSKVFLFGDYIRIFGDYIRIFRDYIRIFGNYIRKFLDYIRKFMLLSNPFIIIIIVIYTPCNLGIIRGRRTYLGIRKAYFMALATLGIIYVYAF